MKRTCILFSHRDVLLSNNDVEYYPEPLALVSFYKTFDSFWPCLAVVGRV